jgi:Transposase DDE domain.
VIIDATDLIVPDSFPEDACGVVTRKKKVTDKRGRTQEVEVTVRGFKLITVLWQKGRIPLAAKIVKINEHEVGYTLELIRKAQENIAPHARISRLVFDKGFLDGPTLYELDKMHIGFVVPAKDNMRVTSDARSIAASGEGHVASRTTEVSHGYGSEKTTERLLTELVGIEGLCTYDQYCPGEEVSHILRKDYVPQPINAVVVRKWDNKDFGPSGKTVFLTNEQVTDPFVPFDGYDERSTIENLLHREGKQAFGLGIIPKKHPNAVYAHVYMVLTTFALVQAYRAYQERERDQDAELWPTNKTLDEDSPEPAPSTKRPTRKADPFHGIGMARWRRQLARDNMDKVIVFYQDSYGIFNLAELGILSGMRFKASREDRESTARILERYGIDPSP